MLAHHLRKLCTKHIRHHLPGDSFSRFLLVTRIAGSKTLPSSYRCRRHIRFYEAYLHGSDTGVVGNVQQSESRSTMPCTCSTGPIVSATSMRTKQSRTVAANVLLSS